MPRSPLRIKLSPEELGKLNAFSSKMSVKGKRRVHKRATALWNSSELGWTVKQIAEFLGRSPRTVYTWFRNYLRNGLAGLYDKPRPFSLTSEQIKELMQVSGWANVDNLSLRWSFTKISGWVMEKWGVTISAKRLSQIIRKKLRDPADVF